MPLTNTKLAHSSAEIFAVLASVLCYGVSGSASFSDITLVASTPEDEEIKSLLDIRTARKVDFIRWNLILSDGRSGNSIRGIPAQCPWICRWWRKNRLIINEPRINVKWREAA